MPVFNRSNVSLHLLSTFAIRYDPTVRHWITLSVYRCGNTTLSASVFIAFATSTQLADECAFSTVVFESSTSHSTTGLVDSASLHNGRIVFSNVACGSQSP